LFLAMAQPKPDKKGRKTMKNFMPIYFAIFLYRFATSSIPHKSRE
jgi:hypothetical protein